LTFLSSGYATLLIAHNYNSKVDVAAFENEARRILAEVEKECGWMYETLHTDGTIGKINYTVWSDVFICPYCGAEIVFYDAAVDKESGSVLDDFPCSACKAELKKTDCNRAIVDIYDDVLNQTIQQAKQIPVLINYNLGKKRVEKKPDEKDLALIEKINNSSIPYWYPTDRMPEGDEARRNDRTGITHVHHFYTKRNLWVLAAVWNRLNQNNSKVKDYLRFTFEQIIFGFSKIARYVPTHFSQVNQYLSGTLYIGSQIVEVSLEYIINGKIKRLPKVILASQCIDDFTNVSTQSATILNNISNNSIDYIFTDPPFGKRKYRRRSFMFIKMAEYLITNIH